MLQVHSLDEISSDQMFDLILCVDVLEHLADSGQVFFSLDKRLHEGGYLVLQAPWGGIPEHIPEALENWIHSGAQRRLEEGYEKIGNLNPFILACRHGVSAIYRKTSSSF